MIMQRALLASNRPGSVLPESPVDLYQLDGCFTADGLAGSSDPVGIFYALNRR